MGVARDHVGQSELEEFHSRPVDLAAEAAGQALGRDLAESAPFHQIVEGAGGPGEDGVPFRMADDGDEIVPHHAAHEVGGPVRKTPGREFDKNIARAVDGQAEISDGLDQAPDVADLGARQELEAPGARAGQELVDPGLEVFDVPARPGHPEDVRGQDDPGDAVSLGGLHDAERFGGVGRAVIPIRKEMVMEIDHPSVRFRSP